ncbi:integrase catalytic domain-containing protein [Nephila pilipes]|uniref:Integrase catalytic domain-containing protein n=1 Tax=Nephila pilipes TaxID=299642 RepID=A0A8X6PF57_NEPPI|nr:integrase catalytic domain-containing protein [Nephila pilipes]
MNLKGLGEESVNHGLLGGIERAKKHQRYHINLSNVDGNYNCKVQEESFQGEKMQCLKSLSTFKDADGILRIKTKLLMREDNENFKVPIVLPSDYHVVKNLILCKHQDLGHPGARSLMAALRENY